MTDTQRILSRIRKAKAAIARPDLSPDAKLQWLKNFYYWLGFLDARLGEKP